MPQNSLKGKIQFNMSTIGKWTRTVQDDAHDALREVLRESLAKAGVEFQMTSDAAQDELEEITERFKVLATIVLVENQLTAQAQKTK